MRIRRHSGPGPDREGSVPAGEPAAGTPAETPPATLPDTPPDALPRAAWLRRLPRWARDVGLLVLLFVVGYAVISLWLAPPTGADEHAVPRVLDRSLADARAELEQAGFRTRVAGNRPNAAVPRGAVMWQDPPGGTVLPAGAAITLTVSTGPDVVPVPELSGLDVATATAVLEGAGLRVGGIDSVPGTELSDVVLGSRPAAGSGQRSGETVDLIVGVPGRPRRPLGAWLLRRDPFGATIEREP